MRESVWVGRENSVTLANRKKGGCDQNLAGKNEGLTLSPTPGIPDPRGFALVLGCDQGHMHQMLAQKPHLQFIGPQDVADRQIVGSVVA